MSLTFLTFDTVGYFLFFLVFSIFPTLALLVVITLFFPKSLLERYFKDPHFSQGEVAFYSRFPLTNMRTIVFFRAFLTPRSMKVRKMTDIREHTSIWFVWLGVTWIIWLFTLMTLVITLMAGLLIYIEFFK